MKKKDEKLVVDKESGDRSSGRDSGSSKTGGFSKTSVTVEERKSAHKTAQKKGADSAAGKIKSVGSLISTASRFLKESRTELKKVKWPTKKELLASTAVVIVLVLIVSLYLGIVDFGLIKLVKGVVG
ncbi:MAG: preprotein translocase subunit SecE [Desulfobacteraceae bacterium]|nr:MAG: preprotein translocase subunit SecE [Desulfobacteraceae bacterium]